MKFLFIIIYFIPSVFVLGQPIQIENATNTNGDLIQRFVVCQDNNFIPLKPNEPIDPTKCYIWGPISQISGSYSRYQVMGHPSHTTLYTCNKIDCSTGSIIKSYYIKVYVIESIEISELNGLNGSCEGLTGPCYMDEHTKLNFKGVLSGIDVKEITTKKMAINFVFKTTQGHKIIPKAALTIINGEFTLLDFVVPTVMSTGKNYLLSINAKWSNATGISCISNTLQINIARLWIEYISDKDVSEANRDLWQIVIGNQIKYKAIAASYCHDFVWKFPQKWGSPSNNNQKEGLDMEFAQTVINKYTKNSDFGKANGIVYLECLDHKNKKIIVTSDIYVENSKTNNNPNSPSSQSLPFRYMGNGKRCSFFYIKHEVWPYSNAKPAIPNWFRFWAQHGLAYYKDYLYSGINSVNYMGDGIFPGYNLWGLTTRGHTPDDFRKWYSSKTSVSDQASRLDEVTNETGIHCFNSVIFHETYHVEIMRILWPNGYLNDGIYGKTDDDLDLYPDDWETKDMEAKMYGFKVRINPDGKTPDVLDQYIVSFVNESNGYKFEEDKCRKYQTMNCKDGKCNDFDSFDWSYDIARPNGQERYQGKQFKE